MIGRPLRSTTNSGSVFTISYCPTSMKCRDRNAPGADAKVRRAVCAAAGPSAARKIRGREPVAARCA
ncbi:hypothetical protein AB0I69_34835, partial [Streptomyces sp. NPDC050508]|uniref:hypothetical protein n=1 Tax=Streptomyces sp. NPDC050508 TaxID=3155405 RepID=UPI0034180D11